MLLGSPPDMVHAAPAHGAHVALSAAFIIHYFFMNCKAENVGL